MLTAVQGFFLAQKGGWKKVLTQRAGAIKMHGFLNYSTHNDRGLKSDKRVGLCEREHVRVGVVSLN